jgi:hypothetical protein
MLAGQAVGGDAAAAQQVTAVEHLRSDSDMAALVARGMLKEGQVLGLKASPEMEIMVLADVSRCASAANPSSYVC